MSLLDFLQNNSSIHKISDFLDGLSSEERLSESRTLNRAQQRKLYELAKEAPPLELEHFVPTQDPCVEVIHSGRNTLPLPASLKLFEKRFRRQKNIHLGLFISSP